MAEGASPENTAATMRAGGAPSVPDATGWPGIDRALAARIRLVGLDVDGTLTDGGIYLGAAHAATDATERGDGTVPFELKRYDIQDGLGVTLLREAGVRVVIVTGRESESVRQRARELQVDAVAQDARAHKLAAWRRVLHDLGATNQEAAFIGDDLPDLAILREVALPVAVGNAVPEIHDVATLSLVRRGGYGAVREFAERLLTARGTWHDAVERYVAARSADAPAAPVARPTTAGAS